VTVTELIEVLQRLPGHHPVRDAIGDVVVGADLAATYSNQLTGPVVVLHTKSPR
jgi:hypothetical protein